MSGFDSLEWRRGKAADLAKVTERRAFTAPGLQVRTVGDGGMRLSGHASVTETPYPVGFYVETIARGAFRRTLSEDPDVQLLLNHGVGGQLPLARTRSGTLRLSEDEIGLAVDADLDEDDPEAQRLARSMKRGDIDQMSFAFIVTGEKWNDDFTERRITGLSLNRGDVSVVNQGANAASTATIRAALDADADAEWRVQYDVPTAHLEAKIRRRQQGASSPRRAIEEPGATLSPAEQRALQRKRDLRR